MRNGKWEVGGEKSDNMSGYEIAWYQALELLSFAGYGGVSQASYYAVFAYRGN